MRTVHFASAQAAASPAVQSQPLLTSEEIATTWYSAKEQEQLKATAREDTRLLIAKRGSMKRSRSSTGGLVEKEEKQCYRGLEHRASLGRAKRKCVAIRAVLEAQRRLKNGFETDTDPAIIISILSQKFTRVSAEEARLRGNSDFLVAYQAYLVDSEAIKPASGGKRRLSCGTSAVTDTT
eukprot:CAMPEP_0113584408 /NCGR_PEP_ID=MMETSP0015_2-20120614/33090_1 /TAXON_ID=2838 /ORGANISM="Odontella" /LENGTH=179 /DNA_ID=CAMNT_0000489461 /DNA_START=18 /DNA_END=554 /DNA_ORIENTATION=- /assembly_acc=CAM_ASM_000160